jgi:hypothetical protein
MSLRMGSDSRHQCLIYEGPASQQLPAVAAAMRERLQKNYRCLYLNSPSMVSGMRWCLSASGMNVAGESARGSLVLSSQQTLLPGGIFDVQYMLNALKAGLDSALNDGYKGLFATGDIGWEFGPQKDFSRLLEYEQRLEEFMHAHPEMCGICQYRADILPRATTRHGLITHTAIFVNETVSLVNPKYLRPERFAHEKAENFELDAFINRLIDDESMN